MNFTKTVIMSIIKVANGISNRKQLQNIFFILKSMSYIDQPKDFKYKYYGPCSLIFEYEIDELINDGFLTETDGILSFASCVCFDVDENIYAKKELIKSLAQTRYECGVLELVSIIFYLRENGYCDDVYVRNKLILLRPKLYWAIPIAIRLHYKIIQGEYI